MEGTEDLTMVEATGAMATEAIMAAMGAMEVKSYYFIVSKIHNLIMMTLGYGGYGYRG